MTVNEGGGGGSGKGLFWIGVPVDLAEKLLGKPRTGTGFNLLQDQRTRKKETCPCLMAPNLKGNEQARMPGSPPVEVQQGCIGREQEKWKGLDFS